MPHSPAQTLTTVNGSRTLRDWYEQSADDPDHPYLGYLYAWAAKYKSVLELGVYQGHSTAAFLAAADTYGGRVWSIDRDGSNYPAELAFHPRWHFFEGNSASEEAANWAPPSFDLLFVDSDHSFEHALAELTIYGPRVRPGGVILCHDTDQLDVREAIDMWTSRMGLTWWDYRQPVPHWHGVGVIEIPQVARAARNGAMWWAHDHHAPS